MVLTEDGGKTSSCLVNVSASGLANVSGFTVVPGNTTIDLSWTNPTAADFDSVVISANPAHGELASPRIINKTDSPNNSWTVADLTNGTPYTITIKAHYTTGGYSGGTAVTVIPASPVPSTDLSSLVSAPVTGANQSIAGTYPPWCYGANLVWKNSDGTNTTDTRFLAGKVYKADLTITTKAAYTFSGAAPFSHTGASAISPVYSSDYTQAVVTITFPATATVQVTGKISSAGTGLPGALVQLKKAGVNYLSPALSIADGTYAISGVEEGSYTAVVSKAGYGEYTISSFIVDFANVTKNATLKTTVTETNLSAITTPPVASGAPVTPALTSAQYSLASSPAPAWRTAGDQTFSNFEPGTAYKLTVTLSAPAASGWTFTGLTASSFTFTGADSVTATINPAGTTATVVITFPPVQWIPVDVEDQLSPGATVEAQLNWIKANGVPGTNYTITVTGTENVNPQELNVVDDNRLVNVCITLKGGESGGTLQLAPTTGSLFTLTGFNSATRIALVLENITLEGRTSNNASVVQVNGYATLTMETGVVIRGNHTSYSGAGVYVASSGSFTMNGGEISGNTTSGGYGGGVYAIGRFTMAGGKISGNTANGSFGGGYGGGLYAEGTFIMTGGEISGNTASGGGYGGGVHTRSAAITGGKISGNTASGGGGVYTSIGTFNMTGGEISGNTATGLSGGGGVYASNGSNATFTKTGTGVIYGDTDNTHTPDSTENTAIAGPGHAVKVGGDARKRDSDAPAGVNISTGGINPADGWD
jgi:hypothetical protein